MFFSLFSIFFLMIFFFFNDTATTEIYTLSLHDALPLSALHDVCGTRRGDGWVRGKAVRDRKSTRLNSSHEWISYAVFCLKKKKMHYFGSCLVCRKSLTDEKGPDQLEY